MISLNELAEFLDHFFAVHLYQGDQGGVYRASLRPLRRLGVALEPWPQLAAWIRDEDLDALFLHRPWQLEPQQLAGDIGIVGGQRPESASSSLDTGEVRSGDCVP